MDLSKMPANVWLPAQLPTGEKFELLREVLSDGTERFLSRELPTPQVQNPVQPAQKATTDLASADKERVFP